MLTMGSSVGLLRHKGIKGRRADKLYYQLKYYEKNLISTLALCINLFSVDGYSIRGNHEEIMIIV